MKQLRITVAGQTFDVTVETLGGSNAPAPAPAPVAAPAPLPVAAPAPVPTPVAAPAAAPAPAAGGTPIPSPLAGKVVSLDVKPGAAVKEGDQVLTLEAMKMNTVIYAPAAGTIASFSVNPGDTGTGPRHARLRLPVPASNDEAVLSFLSRLIY